MCRMNMGRQARIVSILILMAANAAICLRAADQAWPRIRVRADSRIELFCTIFRLAGNPEYGQNEVPSYVNVIEKDFGPLKNHPAVRMAAQLRETRGIGYDAPLSLAVHVTDPGELREITPLDPRPPGLDARWHADEAREFLALARDFAKAARFEEFFMSRKEYYYESGKCMENLIESFHIREWFQQYFGKTRDVDVDVVIGMQLGGNNYGLRVKVPGARELVYAIKGVWQADASGIARFGKRDAEMLVHELCHAFANPVIDTNIQALRAPAETLFPYVEFEMNLQSYGRPEIMLYESLVRALVIRYLSHYSDTDYTNMILGLERKQNGFPWMKELSVLLESYERNRAIYPDLDSFAPQVVEFFRGYAKDIKRKLTELENEDRAKWKHLESRAPRVVSMVPKNGDMNVDPGLKEITITFDKPVQGIGLLQFGRSTSYPLARQGWKYDSTGTILTVPVQLRPEGYYTFGLNGENALFIQDRDGNPLVPVVVKFKTRK